MACLCLRCLVCFLDLARVGDAFGGVGEPFVVFPITWLSPNEVMTPPLAEPSPTELPSTSSCPIRIVADPPWEKNPALSALVVLSEIVVWKAVIVACPPLPEVLVPQFAPLGVPLYPKEAATTPQLLFWNWSLSRVILPLPPEAGSSISPGELLL